jgi:hypothetical protein
VVRDGHRDERHQEAGCASRTVLIRKENIEPSPDDVTRIRIELAVLEERYRRASNFDGFFVLAGLCAVLSLAFLFDGNTTASGWAAFAAGGLTWHCFDKKAECERIRRRQSELKDLLEKASCTNP